MEIDMIGFGDLSCILLSNTLRRLLQRNISRLQEYLLLHDYGLKAERMQRLEITSSALQSHAAARTSTIRS